MRFWPGGAKFEHLRRRLACWAAAAGLWSGLASAQSAPSATEGCPAPAVSPQTRSEQINSLYQRFECHFQRGDYAACLPFLEQACDLTDSPRCLLNLGAVHHALMHCQLARGYYEQYLSRSPYGEEGDEARRALEELDAACRDPAPGAAPLAAEGGAAAPPPPGVVSAQSAVGGGAEASATDDVPLMPPRAPAPFRAPDPSPRERRGQSLLTWSLLGAGAVGLTGTLIAAGYGMQAERDFERLDRQNGALDPATDPRLRAIDRRGRQYNRLATGLGAISGLLLGAGATFWILDDGAGASVAVSGDGFPSVSYEGRF